MSIRIDVEFLTMAHVKAQVLIYYWDERDGPSFNGWWFGPKASAEFRAQLAVWVYHGSLVTLRLLRPSGAWEGPGALAQGL